MDSEVGFNIITNMIKTQNKKLLEQLAKDYDLDVHILKESYLKPEYYLPIVQNTKCSK